MESFPSESKGLGIRRRDGVSFSQRGKKADVPASPTRQRDEFPLLGLPIPLRFSVGWMRPHTIGVGGEGGEGDGFLVKC